MWNYRVATRFCPYPSDMAKKVKRKGNRVFSIVEVFYDPKTEKPNAYGENNILSDCETLKDLKWSHKVIYDALKKPILDLDNFPKIYKPKKKT